MKKNILLFITLLDSLFFLPLHAQEQVLSWEKLDKRPIPTWWSDAKFGIFVHWGLYSVPAYAPVRELKGVYERYAEHYYARLLSNNKLFTDYHNRVYGEKFKYADFAQQFKAENFNPDEWSKLFEQAGAKYVVLTSKHHDGFCLWNSAYAPHWNSVVMGPHKDLIDSLSHSVVKHGLHFGLYYSLLEWAHPLYSKATINNWVDDHLIPQMKELVVKYKPEVIFADGEWDYNSEVLKSRRFLSWLYKESPVKNTIVVNDRWGAETRGKHGDYYTTEYNLVHDKEGIGDKAQHPWEESRGIGTSYGYNRFESVGDYESSEELIHLLVRTVANGGNLLLDVGPTADGMIPVVMQERLLDIGDWLKVNGEAIYASKPWRGNVIGNEGMYTTQRDGNVYIICTTWPGKAIVVDGIKKIKGVEMLGSKSKLMLRRQGTHLTINVPMMTIDQLPSKLAWVIKLKGAAYE